MDAYECLMTRRTIRRFDDRRVSDDEIKKLIAAAVQAPCGGNNQLWRFAVLRDEAVDHLQKETGVDYYGARCVVAVFIEHIPSIYNRNRWTPVENPDYGTGFACVQNLVLAAHAIGLGTCWCKPYPPLLAERIIGGMFGLGEEHVLLANVAIGGYDKAPEGPARWPVERYLLKPKRG
jgi:nitroreductase